MRYINHVFQTPSEVLDRLGGATVVATELQLQRSTVASWSNRQSIPLVVWQQLIGMAADRNVEGLTIDTLHRAHVAASEAKANGRPSDLDKSQKGDAA